MKKSLQKQLFEIDDDMPQVFLKPAELYIAREPTIITTLLGSCVGLVFYLPKKKVSAVCHCLLPEKGMQDENPFRFVDSSVHYILEKLKKGYQRRGDLQVKLFGGADMIEAKSVTSGHMAQIGRLNVAAARRILERYGLRPQCEEVGGFKGYKLYIRSDTGVVYMKRLNTSHEPLLAEHLVLNSLGMRGSRTSSGAFK